MKKWRLPQRRRFLPYADFICRVNSFAWEAYSDVEIKEKLAEWKGMDVGGRFSLLKEVVRRRTGLTLYDSQTAASYAMVRGEIAELATGEGKTLCAVVAAAYLALSGRRVHVLVFNDYLAKRDWRTGKGIFEFCGVTPGIVLEESGFSQRKEAYGRSVVYAAAKEVGFDFLRNFLCVDAGEWIEIPLEAVIVDEADSILIDEARIPLVLAGEDGEGADQAEAVWRIVTRLTEEETGFNRKENQVWLKSKGIDRVESELGIGNLYEEKNGDLLALFQAALEAKLLLLRDRDYLVRDGKLLLIDQNTGRAAENRRYPELLHRAAERKEGLVSGMPRTRIYHSMPLSFFLLKYESLCGMTGTAYACRRELESRYGLAVTVIPPHTPCIRQDHGDRLFDTEEEKERAVVEEVLRAHRKGQPVLMGTQSVEDSERYSRLLAEAAVPHCVLNARDDRREAELIARGGLPGRVTVSTNMAGRGVDIHLGGGNGSAEETAKEAGGLYVIGCGLNRNERIDFQLRGRAGRQGDPGESRFFISREDPLALMSGVGTWTGEAEGLRSLQRAVAREDVECRYLMEKYALIIEAQRQKITEWRETILFRDGEKREILLYLINEGWADYLAEMDNLKSGIHLTLIGGQNPFEEYEKAAMEAFCAMERDVCRSAEQWQGEAPARTGSSRTGALWTCQVDESPAQFSRLGRRRDFSQKKE